MRLLFPIFISFLIILNSCSKGEPVLKIGLVADPQYADKPVAGIRYYRESLWKLSEAIDTFNYNNVDFVQNLGDIIDLEWGSYDSILPVYRHLNPGINNYHLLGNHDFAIDSSHLENLLEALSMPDYYYSYEKRGWRFIVLDATDYAFYSNFLHKHDITMMNSYFEQTTGKANNFRWNGAIGEEQQDWIKQELDAAELKDQAVIIFSHMPLKPFDIHENLWNKNEIIEIIEKSPNVVAFINGHNHAGDYVFSNGIHYITMVGMVDSLISSYGILNIYKDSLVLNGYGRQKSILLE